MPVDASPYNRNPNQGPNLLQQIQELGGAANTLGQIEVGKGLQQAIQPDGTVDRNILAQHLKGSVAGSMKAQEALHANEGLRSAGYQADAAGLDTMGKQLGFVGSIISPLAEEAQRNGGRLSKEKFKSGVERFMKLAPQYGLSNPVVEGMKLLTEVDRMPDDKAVGSHVLSMRTQLMNNQAAFEATRMRTQPFNTGAQSGETPAGSLANPAPQTIRSQRPPGSQYTVDDPNDPNFGQQRVTDEGAAGPPTITPTGRAPVRQALDGARVLSVGQPTNAATGQPIQRPAGFAVPTAPAAAAAAPASAAVGLPIGEGIVPAESADTYSKALKEAGTYAERVNPIREAIKTIDKMPKGSTGPGTEGINKIKAALQVAGIPIPGEETMNDFGKLHKYLAQNASAVAPPGTNVPGVLQSLASNPNTSQPKEVLADLSKTVFALMRMKQAATLEFQDAVKNKELFNGRPIRPRDFNEWAAQWSTRQDPRAYKADMMDKKERDKIRAIDPESPAWGRFQQSYQSAKRVRD